MQKAGPWQAHSVASVGAASSLYSAGSQAEGVSQLPCLLLLCSLVAAVGPEGQEPAGRGLEEEPAPDCG